MDIFDKIKGNRGPLGKFSSVAHGYFTFPKLEGEISNKMIFRGNKMLCWSLNNYLGLANHPEVRKIDTEATIEYGLSYPMGARMMSGNTKKHEELEALLANYVQKQDAILLNFGYQGCVSAIDALVNRNDVIVYDSESHACILDGVRMHLGKRFVYNHNDIDSLKIQLKRAEKLIAKTKGGILVITEGVFGMSGDQGKLKEIVELKKQFSFRLFVDDAHGIGVFGEKGAGTGVEQGCQNGIDVYFGTFAKAFASIGGFVASDENVIDYLRYNCRSQIFAKSLPIPLIIGIIKRLELIKNNPEIRKKVWTIVHALQGGLRSKEFNLGLTNSPITPILLNGSVEEAANIVFDLRENHNLFCSLVSYPVVPKGIIMLRLIPTAMHTLEDVEYTIKKFEIMKKKLDADEYAKEKIIMS